MNALSFRCLAVLALLAFGPTILQAGNLVGHVRDPNWYARRQSADPFGVGYYEFAVNANATNVSSAGGAAGTDVFGAFRMDNLPAGAYTIASWDVWWRSAYLFDFPVPAGGDSADADLRLQATMWGYPSFWDSTGYAEFGQTFVASGPISMIYLRDPLGTAFTRTVSVHAGGPGGSQVGVTRTYGSGGDQRLIYGYGDMPTVRGHTYYLRVRSPSPTQGLVLMQMDPRPDFSDPMPGGCLYLGDQSGVSPFPDRDLGVIIMSDDDGLITDLFARAGGPTFGNVTNVGQTFVARGVSLISAAFWLADPAGYTYVVAVCQGGPGGTRVGTTKRNKPARLGADPEMIVCWAPGECPLTPGQTYYVEVSRDGGSPFGAVYANQYNPFAYGQAYSNGVAVPNTDLAGTLMEEESVGSARRPRIRFTSEPTVTEPNRGTTELTVTWTTDVAADTVVEYAIDTPPYTATNSNPALVTAHSITLSNLPSHALVHYRASSSRSGDRPALGRDQVICTRPAAPNLLANPGFEEGSGASPRSPIAGWTAVGLDVRAADGSWFGGLPARTGAWFAEGALNGANAEGYIFQRVTNVVAGRTYTFSAWTTTWPRENNTWKYDEWNRYDGDRLCWMRLGMDPTGGTAPTATTVRWTPRFYSHLRYTQVAQSVVAQSGALTVFVQMQGRNLQWHLFGVDDCALSTEEPPPTHAFESLPVWDSAHDLPDSSHAAVFSVVSGGQSGNALRATRPTAGSSARVLVLPIQPGTDYAISLLARGPASADTYTNLAAFRPGQHSAASLNLTPDGWTVLHQFSNAGLNGNGDTWTAYSATFQSGTNARVSVGFKAASAPGSGPPVQWDSLRLEAFVRPAPVLALADRAAGTITLTFSRPVKETAATNLANYRAAVPGGGPVLTLLDARLTTGTNVVLTTTPQAMRADYVLTVSNVADRAQWVSAPFLNGQVPVRVAHSLVAMDATTLWRYNQSGVDPGPSWRGTAFNDSAWPRGAPLFGYETCVGNCLPDLIRTPLTLATNKPTFYFRTAFTVPAGVTNAPLRLRHVVDDGAVFHLNGAEFHRVGMTNPVLHTTYAARTVDNAVLEGPFDLPAVNFRPGTNVLAVEVHQVNATSSDLVFGAALEALLRPSERPAPIIPLAIRRENAEVVLSWNAAEMTLETAPTVTGTWTRIPAAVSPWTNATTAPAQFFRLAE